MKHLTATLCLMIVVLLGTSFLNATRAERALADVIESKKKNIELWEQELARRHAFFETETTEKINDFKAKVQELCKEKYLGNRQNAERAFERRFPETMLPAWLQPLWGDTESRQKEIYSALISPVERGERICIEQSTREFVNKENEKLHAALKDETEMLARAKTELQDLVRKEKEQKEKLRQQEWVKPSPRSVEGIIAHQFKSYANPFDKYITEQKLKCLDAETGKKHHYSKKGNEIITAIGGYGIPHVIGKDVKQNGNKEQYIVNMVLGEVFIDFESREAQMAVLGVPKDLICY